MSYFKKSKKRIINDLVKIFREHMGMNKTIANDVASSLIRGRDLSSLSTQKNWQLDWIKIITECEKIKKVEIYSEYLQYVEMLEQFIKH